MKIRNKKAFHAEVATSSLNDIMFFLLLFFLIVSTVANPNVIKVLLPTSKASQAVSKQPINLTITQDKKYYINKQQVPEQNLESELLKAVQGIPEPTVVIRLPYNLAIQDLVDVMQLGAEHKIKMVLATNKK
ncbi:MAG: biopolymer transporter ExbD [Azospira oryzae]|jgi:biopolymer transport protein ExbD|nr:biopolymer transporter ExbD [Cytophaga sp.]PZR30164.1 MAG: biopolymer transporter ExbD [Azospira oryzae]